MDLVQMRYVIELARYKNFSSAAKELFITQPALSQQISKLEAEIGFLLFKRSTTYVDITPEGREFVRYAENVLCEYEKLQRFCVEVSRAKDNNIIFGSGPNSSFYVSACVSQFLLEFPNSNFQFVEAIDQDLIAMLCQRKLDIAWILLPKTQLKQKDLRIYPLVEDTVAVIVSHSDPLSKQKTIKSTELLNRKWIFSAKNSVIQRMVLSEFSQMGEMTNKIMIIGNQNARLPLIRDGAVCFSLQNQQDKQLPDEFCTVPLYSKLDVVFCLAMLKDSKPTLLQQQLMNIIEQQVKRLS